AIATATCSPAISPSCTATGAWGAPAFERPAHAFRSRAAFPVRACARAAGDDRPGDRGPGSRDRAVGPRRHGARSLLGHAARLVLRLSVRAARARTGHRALAQKSTGRAVSCVA